jgi:hypothetical protein
MLARTGTPRRTCLRDPIAALIWAKSTQIYRLAATGTLPVDFTEAGHGELPEMSYANRSRRSEFIK